MIRCKVHLYEAAFLPRGGGPLKRYTPKKAGLIRITSRNPLGVGALAAHWDCLPSQLIWGAQQPPAGDPSGKRVQIVSQYDSPPRIKFEPVIGELLVPSSPGQAVHYSVRMGENVAFYVMVHVYLANFLKVLCLSLAGKTEHFETTEPRAVLSRGVY